MRATNAVANSNVVRGRIFSQSKSQLVVGSRISALKKSGRDAFVIHASKRQDSSSAQVYDVLGIGQLMIDYAAAVDDPMLETLNVPKGGRRVISVVEKAAVMERLQGYESQVSAGGSLANSLVGIAQLAAARERFLAADQPHNAGISPSSPSPSSSSNSGSSTAQQCIRVAMAGCCGGADALGEFGRAQMAAAGVDILSVDDDAKSWSGSATGTVMVFTTPDAQRSFLSSFSSEDHVHLTQQLLDAVSRSRLVIIEGYLWELPGAAEVIPAVVKHARAVGTLVVLTAGDASVVARHGATVLQTIQDGVDMFVSNVAEAQELVSVLHQQARQEHASTEITQLAQSQAQPQQQQQQHGADLQSVVLDPQGSASLDSMWECAAAGSSSGGQVAACELAGVCPLVVVTDGSRGSYITALGQLTVVPPYWRSHAPVDTCGAGDAYCSGLLFAFLLGQDLHNMGHIAAKTASAVISRHGPQLSTTDADAVAGVQLGRGSLAAQFLGSHISSSSSSSVFHNTANTAGQGLWSLGSGANSLLPGSSQLLSSASQ